MCCLSCAEKEITRLQQELSNLIETYAFDRHELARRLLEAERRTEERSDVAVS